MLLLFTKTIHHCRKESKVNSSILIQVYQGLLTNGVNWGILPDVPVQPSLWRGISNFTGTFDFGLVFRNFRISGFFRSLVFPEPFGVFNTGDLPDRDHFHIFSGGFSGGNSLIAGTGPGKFRTHVEMWAGFVRYTGFRRVIQPLRVFTPLVEATF